MPQAREDFDVAKPLSQVDEERMAAFLEDEVVEDAPQPPATEGDEAPEQEVDTTYTPEEEEKPAAEEEQEQPQQEEAPAEEPAEEPVDEADPVYLVTVAGQEMEVPLSELVRGYSRTADYTRKTQLLSEERKQFEQEMADVRAERERNAQLYEQGAAWLDSLMPQEPDWEELRRTNPAEYAAQMAEHQHRREQLRLVEQERQTLQQRQYDDNQRALQAHLKSEREKLQEALPEWNDPQAAQSEMVEIQQAGLSMGFTPEELDQVYDHRAVLVLRKAMLYDKIQAGKPQVVKRARSAPVLKPGAASTTPKKPVPSRLTRAREALRETGSDRAAEAFFFEALQGEGK